MNKKVILLNVKFAIYIAQFFISGALLLNNLVI